MVGAPCRACLEDDQVSAAAATAIIGTRVTFFSCWTSYYLVLAVLLIWPCLGRAQATGAVDLVNRFPSTMTAEAFRSRPVRVSTRFKIYFPVGGERYVPVTERLAMLLSEAPTVRADPDMRIRTLQTACTPQEMTVLAGQGSVRVTGGLVQSEIELTPGESATEGTHAVILAFPLIDLAVKEFNAKAPASKAEVHITVQVWASPEAKREAQYQVRMRVLWRTSVVLVPTLLLGLVAFRHRKWFRPEVKVAMAAGEHQQYHRILPRLAGEQDAEPGTILRTVWAKNWRGRRQRIKVETFVAEDSAGGDPHRLDILISVGASMRRGTYLARGPNGAVRITVHN